MIGLVLQGLLATAAAEEPGPACPEVVPLLDAASAALVELEMAAVRDNLDAADAVLTRCHEVYDAPTLGQLWLLSGVKSFLDGNEEDAKDAFRASGRIAPEAWKDAFGPEVRGMYELAVADSAPLGGLHLQPELGGNRAWLDGEEFADNPHAVESGLHALQISDPTGVVMFSQLLWIPPDDTLRLETGIPTAAVSLGPAPAPGPGPMAPEKVHVDPLLVAGIGAMVVGGTALAFSFERAGAMDEAEDWKSLRARYHEHGIARIGGIGLLAAGGATMALSFAF